MRPPFRDVLGEVPGGAIGAVALAYVLVALAGRAFGNVVGVPVHAPPGLVLALALLGGGVVAWGAALGHVVTDVLGGTFGPETGVAVLAQFVLVVAAVRLWGTFGPLSAHEPPGTASLRNAVEFVAVAVTAAFLLGSLVAWGATLFATAPFRVVVVDETLGSLASMLTLGTTVLYLGPRVLDRSGRSLPEWLSSPFERPAGRSSRAGVVVLVLAVGWAVGGFWIGLFFELVGGTRRHLLVNRLGRGAVAILDLGGDGGVVALSVLGACALGVASYVLLESRVPDPE